MKQTASASAPAAFSSPGLAPASSRGQEAEAGARQLGGGLQEGAEEQQAFSSLYPQRQQHLQLFLVILTTAAHRASEAIRTLAMFAV